MPSSRRIPCFVLLAVLAAGVVACAAPNRTAPPPPPALLPPPLIAANPVQIDAARIARARVAAEELVTKRGLPGLRVAIIKSGTRVAELTVPKDAGCGVGDAALPAPAPECAYRIGSVTKGFTSVLALKLASAERLDLDERIGRYLPALPPAYGALTTRQLLTHIAGLPHYGRDDYFNTVEYPSVTASLARFVDKPLIAAPGERYAYSSYGYTLAGAVIEAACGKPYLECLREQLLTPLALTTVTTERGALAPPAPHAEFLDRDLAGTGFVASAPMDLSDRWPAGGLLAGMPDLARFGWAVGFSDLIDPVARAALFNRQTLLDGKSIPLGLGWRIGEDHLSRRMYALTGDAVGGRAVLVVYPTERLVVAMASDLSLARFTEFDVAAIAAPWFD